MVAEKLNIPLKIAGQGDIEGLKGERLGIVDIEQRKELLSHAKVLFLPTLYLEPFGGTSVEAMLSGTPAVTTDFGVFPETIRNGVGGYRCSTLQDFVDNTKKAMNLDRQGVRLYAEKYLMDNVWRDFEKWYNDIYQVYLSTQGDKGWSKLK